jgi:methyl-galactoside transport system ATP-binding protein
LTAQEHAIIMVPPKCRNCSMSDRIMVMCEGRLTTILDNVNTTQVDVMQYATEFSPKICRNGD